MRLILLALLVLTFSTHAEEDLSAKAWLKNMSQALRDKQFKVSIIQLQADHIRPLLYVHGIVDNQEIALLEYLNGPPKNAVRVGNRVTFIEHDQTPYSVTAPRIQGVWPAALAGDISQLEKGYQFVIGGRSRIAGRPGQMIRLLANDENRYDAQVWIDMDTFLPLRFDTLNKEKQLLEQTMVVELIELSEPANILIQAAKQDWPAVMNQAERSDGKNWQFTWLPQGFDVVVRDHHRLIGIHEPVEYIALTDGLANISVYVARSGENPMPNELLTRNGLSMVVVQVGNLEVVAIGKVPAETLEKIANSLVLK
ncbi:MucB/RseB C-terminal domain-containing protein [Shewanella inventionis]|uniref:Sigma-E factor regulatory protein RseB n=1 Tax=Shewanella inventionis TaxID=1738770 RepID=A0ABQ1JTW0_9GAMM|nr:MucB/RseB C-terminal domain-containing protein [Shewanella inventionis]MCL1157866.1 MucB/RseB C-terminal domain-containing protein [Shewanella inventionis]UAL42730.1 MucB/RseB C-terminal domain-containing protein [Shewanella inventionis]GGB74541.1 sigma-E factor regulatory protein RseB [Shewanella inventionis]